MTEKRKYLDLVMYITFTWIYMPWYFTKKPSMQYIVSDELDELSKNMKYWCQ
jgi:hypothetical protein